MDLERLKTETRADHEATESVMPLMQPGLTRQQYIDVLARLYPVVLGWERWALQHAPADLTSLVTARQRAPLLQRDLQSLDADSVEATTTFPAAAVPGLSRAAPAFRASFLGAMYVMEGSTLGGQYIARHLEETLHLQSGEGDAYFRGYGERTGEMWRAFKALLAEVSEDETEVVILAARAMFQVFREGMQAVAVETPL